MDWKLLHFHSYVIEISCHGINSQWYSIVSGKGLVTNRRQAIIWTTDGVVYWIIYASIRPDELSVWCMPTFENEVFYSISSYIGTHLAEPVYTFACIH